MEISLVATIGLFSLFFAFGLLSHLGAVFAEWMVREIKAVVFFDSTEFENITD